MHTVSVVYFSTTGHTQRMAESIVKGAKQVDGTTGQLLEITGEKITQGRWKDEAILEQLNQSDAIVFGSPTYMGGVSAQFKAFIDAASAIWFQQGWKDKVAGGFTHSGSPSGDKQGTLLYLVTNAMQHGMIGVGTGEINTPDSFGLPRRKATHRIECTYNQADTQMDSFKEILTGLLETVGLFTNRNGNFC